MCHPILKIQLNFSKISFSFLQSPKAEDFMSSQFCLMIAGNQLGQMDSNQILFLEFIILNGFNVQAKFM